MVVAFIILYVLGVVGAVPIFAILADEFYGDVEDSKLYMASTILAFFWPHVIILVGIGTIGFALFVIGLRGIFPKWHRPEPIQPADPSSE